MKLHDKILIVQTTYQNMVNRYTRKALHVRENEGV